MTVGTGTPVQQPTPATAPLSGHLRLGEPEGTPDRIDADSRSLWRGEQPWFPVMGEFHYSRYPRAQWKDELRKIRAGGITVVGTYVFWILHEERQGTIRFDRDRDLRHFLELCGEVGLDAVVRIGPWGHGEARNGAFPDWLLATGCRTRTDDAAYLGHVRTWWNAMARQLDGLYHREGGPIVGVQIENELYDQPDHLLTLKNLAKELGIDAALWTVTGWGHAQIPADEFVPLYGGYSEAAWDDPTPGWARQSRLHYFFTKVRDDYTIGSDLRHDNPADIEAAGGIDTTRYPFATCELGGGMYTSYHRRPTIPADDVAALALVKLGSGSSYQGFYMYHGGSQAIGELSTTQESHATGYPNDCPVISYDFQAPLGEYGQARRSYHLLRQQHAWLAQEGPRLARMTVTLPDDGPSDVDDRETLRWALRSDGRSGYIFINNHQPVETLPEHRDVQFTIALGDDVVSVPSAPITVPSGAYVVWPVRHPFAGTEVTATAQILGTVHVDHVPTLVLVSGDGLPVEISVTGTKSSTLISGLEGSLNLIELHDLADSPAQLLVLDQNTAERSWIVPPGDGESLLYFSDSLLLSDDQGDVTAFVTTERVEVTELRTDGPHTVLDTVGVPPPEKVELTPGRPAGAPREIPLGGPLNRPSAPTDADFAEAATWNVVLGPAVLEGTDEVLLRLDYEGDVARLYAGDQLLADHFWYGAPWEVGLRRFADVISRDGLRLEILPLRENAPIHLSSHVKPTFVAGAALGIRLATLHRARMISVPTER
jgi:hypothetical protein